MEERQKNIEDEDEWGDDTPAAKTATLKVNIKPVGEVTSGASSGGAAQGSLLDFNTAPAAITVATIPSAADNWADFGPDPFGDGGSGSKAAESDDFGTFGTDPFGAPLTKSAAPSTNAPAVDLLADVFGPPSSSSGGGGGGGAGGGFGGDFGDFSGAAPANRTSGVSMSGGTGLGMHAASSKPVTAMNAMYSLVNLDNLSLTGNSVPPAPSSGTSPFHAFFVSQGS